MFFLLLVLFKSSFEQVNDSECLIFSVRNCDSFPNCRWSFFGCRLDEASFNCNRTHSTQISCDASFDCQWVSGPAHSVCMRKDKYIDQCYLNYSTGFLGGCSGDSKCEVVADGSNSYCLSVDRPYEDHCLSLDGDYCDSVFPCEWDTHCVVDSSSITCDYLYQSESSCNEDTECLWTEGSQLSVCGSKDRWIDMCYMNHLFNITACSADPLCEVILVTSDDEERAICFSLDRNHNHLCSRYSGETCESVPECVWNVSEGLCVIDETSYNCLRNYTEGQPCNEDDLCAWSQGGENSFCARHNKWVDLCYIRHGQKSDECWSDSDCEMTLLGRQYVCLSLTRPKYDLCGNFTESICNSFSACEWNEQVNRCLIDDVSYSCFLNYTKEGPCFSDKKCQWTNESNHTLCSKHGKYVDLCLLQYGNNTQSCSSDSSCKVMVVNDESLCFVSDKGPDKGGAGYVIPSHGWVTLIVMVVMGIMMVL